MTAIGRRAWLAAGILAAWAAGLAVFLSRELNPSVATRLADVALRVTPITTYYLVERDGRHIGFASIAIDTVPRTLQVTEYLVTDSSSGARLGEQLVVRLSRALALREYELTRINGTDTSRIAGRIADSLLVTTGTASPGSAPAPDPVFPGTIGATVGALLDPPRVGATTSVGVTDPGSGRPGSAALAVRAESLFVVVDSAVADSSGRWYAVHRDTVRAWRFVSTAGPAFDAWLDAQGLVVDAMRPDGLHLHRTAFELAFENWRRTGSAGGVSARADDGIVAATLVASGAPSTDQYLDTLEIRIGASVPAAVVARIGRGWRPGRTVSVARVPDARLRARYALPASDRWRTSFARELAPSPGIESDDPAIARRAVRLAADETDPSAVVQRIVRWVHDSISARVQAPASAAETMAQRAGDAREFALLTTALARAAGVPATPAAGLLHRNGRFFLHAWTEVYVGRWIPVDAMLDQFPADAGHILFTNGSADVGPDLARLLNRLPVSVVRVVPRP